jgi:murein DD-endopeptidase MepM/ murein hydrolase activator NlpD
VAGVATAADICLRAPHLADDLTLSSAALPVLVVVLLGVVVSGRRRRHEGRVHLQWPLGPGTFQIIEGSGRILNHHWIQPSQREALDIVGSAPDGRSHRRLAPQHLSDYPLFGHPVTAPANGTVVARVDGLPDHPVHGGTPAGNHVVIDTGSEHVVLAHLTTGSVHVAKGDHVKAGDLIGRVGSSGNSTEPHLHIHATRHGQPVQLQFPQQPGPIRRNMTIKVNERE